MYLDADDGPFGDSDRSFAEIVARTALCYPSWPYSRYVTLLLTLGYTHTYIVAYSEAIHVAIEKARSMSET